MRRIAAAPMMISLRPLVISSLIVNSLLLEPLQKIASQSIGKTQSAVVARAAITLVGHQNICKLLGLVYRLVALDAQKVGRPLHLVINFLSWANIPLVIRVAELANLSEVRRLRAADLVALLAVVHVREFLTSARVGPHPVTLEARRMSLFDGQFILAGVCLVDSLMTVGTPGALSRG